MLEAGVNLGTNVALRFAKQQRLIVLNYHRVFAHPDPLFPNEPDQVLFAKQINWLKDHFQIVSLREGLENICSGTLLRPQVVITFDDGYRDNCEVVLPVLSAFGVTATFLLVTGELDGGIMWNDQLSCAIHQTKDINFDVVLGEYTFHFDKTKPGEMFSQIETLTQIVKYLPRAQRNNFISELLCDLNVEHSMPENLMLTLEQVKRLSKSGMTIGSHAYRHDVLTSLSLKEAELDLIKSKRMLENIIEDKVEFYAYPNGKPDLDYTSAHIELVKNAGFQFALSSAWGACSSASDHYQIPRLMPWRQSRIGFMSNIIESLYR